jgi:hypothetical protein
MLTLSLERISRAIEPLSRDSQFLHFIPCPASIAHFFLCFYIKYLRMSKKSSTFAAQIMRAKLITGWSGGSK